MTTEKLLSPFFYGISSLHMKRDSRTKGKGGWKVKKPKPVDTISILFRN